MCACAVEIFCAPRRFGLMWDCASEKIRAHVDFGVCALVCVSFDFVGLSMMNIVLFIWL